MISYSDLFVIVDEIRKSKKMSVESLCEGIISERTYYRHMISNQGVRFDVFTKLAKRLEINTYDIIYYATFVRKGDPGLTKFMYRIQIEFFDDIDELYQKMIQYEGDTPEITELIQVYVKKYEMIIGKISQEEYHAKLIQAKRLFDDFPISNETVAFFYTLYLLEFPEDQPLLDKVVQRFIDSDIRVSVSFKMWGMDNLLSILMRIQPSDITKFVLLCDKMDSLMGFYNHKYYTMRNQLYHAFIAKMNQDQNTMEEQLYRHILGLIVLVGRPKYQMCIQEVERVFEVNALELVRTKCRDFLTGEHVSIN